MNSPLRWLLTAAVSATSATAGLHAPGPVPWPGGNVYYEFDPALGVAQRQTYLAGLREWELAADVRFIPHNGEARWVLFKYQEYGPNLVIPPDPGIPGSPETVMIGRLTRHQICHEMGHSFGLEHEHQRTDRDTRITVNYGLVALENHAAFNILPASIPFGGYDFESVMHYGRNVYSMSGQDTITTLPAFEKYQRRLSNATLSPTDRAHLASLYGPPSLSSVVTTTADGGVGSLRAAIYYAQDHPGTTVTFNIPTSDPGHANGAFTIKPTGALPTLATNGLVIDATTQPGYAGQPVVFLNGSELPQDGSLPGLLFYAADCVVKGLGFQQFPWSGIVMQYPDATGNRVLGCSMGVDATGTLARPNGLQGVMISDGAHGNFIGGTGSNERNVISGSNQYGIWISGPATTGNTVAGNFIGTNIAGTAPLPNQIGGVIVIEGAHHNTLARNVISGNVNAGIWLAGGGVTGNEVSANIIGLNAAGTAAVANSFGGIYLVDGATGNHIGGGPGTGNLVSGNAVVGVLVSDSGTSGNFIRNNRIGPDASGSNSLSAQFEGIRLDHGCQGNLIGGTGAGHANLISGNSSVGIVAYNGNVPEDGPTQGHTIRRNSIFANGWKGIALNAGSNRSQAAPTLATAVLATGTTVTGGLTGPVSGSFRIEFFASPDARHFVGETTVTFDGGGDGTFNLTLPATVAAGREISATATSLATGDTSELSAPVTVTALDGDSDGLPDAYESVTPGLSPANALDAALDNDLDGFTNLQEYAAGTNLNDPASRLVTAGAVSGAEFQISFPTVAGKFYRVERSESLVGAWETVAIHVAGTGGSVQVPVPVSPTAGRGFFRVNAGD